MEGLHQPHLSSQVVAQRKRWAERARCFRNSMSTQQREAYLANRRANYHAKRRHLNSLLAVQPPQPTPVNTSHGQRNEIEQLDIHSSDIHASTSKGFRLTDIRRLARLHGTHASSASSSTGDVYTEPYHQTNITTNVDDSRFLYQQEYLNFISPGGMPPHILTVKKGAPIMLLRIIDPKAGLCNGTRLTCIDFLRNVIYAEVLTGQSKGLRVFIPRMSLKTSESLNLPFEMTRKQFPVRLSFALTINKAQGQTIPNVGIYLSEHVFSHGQLYVSLSRGVSMASTKILVKKGTMLGLNGVYTRNVVYRSVLLT